MPCAPPVITATRPSTRNACRPAASAAGVTTIPTDRSRARPWRRSGRSMNSCQVPAPACWRRSYFRPRCVEARLHRLQVAAGERHVVDHAGALRRHRPVPVDVQHRLRAAARTATRRGSRGRAGGLPAGRAGRSRSRASASRLFGGDGEVVHAEDHVALLVAMRVQARFQATSTSAPIVAPRLQPRVRLRGGVERVAFDRRQLDRAVGERVPRRAAARSASCARVAT